ncbi:SpoIIE family protein phosphatase [Kitasatospora sp. RB6PN24]|uniref:SpoIIE family protein phosphatase n=1 Tax=Kitasatospora humi TaxID=2893891 RepID=UPI001E36F0C4|nr:SpoIIE family protein phosphatase [Kitasatospora humi]MCC9306033.1 SpoIIE family protein phosphatase [Kitasatospora humi]
MAERLGPADAALAAGGLLDVLKVAAVVVDEQGRISLWSPQAQELFGYTSEEALGRAAADLLVGADRRQAVLEAFARVMAGEGTWAGAFPVRHRDGHTVLVEMRNMRMQASSGAWYALGIASTRETLQRVERGLALSARLVDQSPIGLAVLDEALRYVLVNPALERINGVPAAEHLGRTPHEVLPHLEVAAIEDRMRRVLATGRPVLEEFTVGHMPHDGRDHAWTSSFYRLEDQAHRVMGLAISVVDVTEPYEQSLAAARARRRLSLIADASIRVGTTLDLPTTARELAEVTVPEVADIAAVDLLDAALPGATTRADDGPARFRAMAIKAAYPTPATEAADRVGEVTRYHPGRLVTQAAVGGHPVLLSHVRAADMPRIARDDQAADLLSEAGVHSYLAVPLIARGKVLGALDLKRTRNPAPFDQDDVLLATELAARAAVAIDNARWYQHQRQATLALQRHLLPPQQGPQPPGLAIAHRYQPASAADEIGGDWFDAICLQDGRTALVVGDVMGSGIKAAATMGQLRTTTRALARLGPDPADLLSHLDATTRDLGAAMATCLIALYDPASGRCRLASAGHPPPVLARPGHAPRPIGLDPGPPLGVGGLPFPARDLTLRTGDDLVLYTDGLIEVRDQDIDRRLQTLTDVLAGPRRPLEDTCDLILTALRRPDTQDDVALLIARVLTAPPDTPPP